MEKMFDIDAFIANPSGPHQTRLSLKDQDTLTWHCSQDFRVLNVQQDPSSPDPDKPPNPFFRILPYDARKGSGNRFRANSGPPVSGAVGQQYKATFRVGGTIHDPDIIIDP